MSNYTTFPHLSHLPSFGLPKILILTSVSHRSSVGTQSSRQEVRYQITENELSKKCQLIVKRVSNFFHCYPINIIADEVIRLTGVKTKESYPTTLRRVTAHVEINKHWHDLVFLTKTWLGFSNQILSLKKSAPLARKQSDIMAHPLAIG